MADDTKKRELQMKLVSKALTAVRKHFMEIKILTPRENAAYKDVDKILNEAQKLEINYKKLEKQLKA